MLRALVGDGQVGGAVCTHKQPAGRTGAKKPQKQTQKRLIMCTMQQHPGIGRNWKN